MKDISRRDLLRLMGFGLVGRVGDVLGNDKLDKSSGDFMASDFNNTGLNNKLVQPKPYVANVVISSSEGATFFNLNNPSFSYPIALGIMFPGKFDGLLKLSLINVDTRETVISGGRRVKGDGESGDRGVFHIVNREDKNRLAPFYLYRAEWEMDGIYLSCLPFGRALRDSDRQLK